MPKPGRLRVFPADRPACELILDQRRTYIVGRDTAADCQIEDDGISRRHLSIDTRSEPWQLCDLGSKNGSRINGRPLGLEELANGAWLSLAGIPARLDRLSRPQLAAWQEELTARQQATTRLVEQIVPLQDQDDILRNTLDAFVSIGECEQGALILANADGSRRIATLAGWDRFTGNLDIVARVLATHSPALITDHHADHEQDAQPRATNSQAPSAIACVPLVLAGEVRGALYGQSAKTGKFFSQLDLEMMEALARQAIFALGLSHLRQELKLVQKQLPGNRQALEADAGMTDRIGLLLPPLKA